MRYSLLMEKPNKNKGKRKFKEPFTNETKGKLSPLKAVRGEKRMLGASQDLEHGNAKGLPNSVRFSKSYGQRVSPALPRKSKDTISLPRTRLAVDGYALRVKERGSKEMPQVRETNKTSWGSEAEWYSNHLEEGDTYHAKVILPNVERIVAPHTGLKVLEIGCGEGFIARALEGAGASVTGCDISPELIEIAKKKGGRIVYKVSKAEKLDWVTAHEYDVVLAVLTLQNMEKIEPVFEGVVKALKNNGRLIFVLNHPAFRIPKASAWGYDEEVQIQYRRTDAYLSQRRAQIDMHPGTSGKKSVTYSFHRSLQDYMKALKASGFAITRLEEWISHRTSEKGPRERAENTARKEFPLFMMIEAKIVK